MNLPTRRLKCRHSPQFDERKTGREDKYAFPVLRHSRKIAFVTMLHLRPILHTLKVEMALFIVELTLL